MKRVLGLLLLSRLLTLNAAKMKEGLRHASALATCSPLTNHGDAFFTVPLCVGTPPQCFEVIADTGSNHVIVPSCPAESGVKCFHGHRSSSFVLPDSHISTPLSFDSGDIAADIASDVVKVGGASANMNKGILLMTNRTELDIDAKFPGILGLGVPFSLSSFLQQESAVTVPFGGAASDSVQNILCIAFPEICRKGGKPRKGNLVTAMNLGEAGNPLFLTQAAIQSFSICFRANSQEGSFRMNIPALTNPLSNVGKFHWGLNFQGLSVSEGTAPAIFCGPDSQKPGMDSPCSIIPDSGSTMIMGPVQDVMHLEDNLCAKWPRCVAYAETQKTRPCAVFFRALLNNCSDWLTHDDGFSEIPSVFLHIRGADGVTRPFELTSWSWLAQKLIQDGGVREAVSERVLPHSGGTLMCLSSFQGMKEESSASQNGPTWIFGAPLFFDYTVKYDMHSRHIELAQGECEQCSPTGEDASLVTKQKTRSRVPRLMQGSPRIPYIDTRIPL